MPGVSSSERSAPTEPCTVSSDASLRVTTPATAPRAPTPSIARAMRRTLLASPSGVPCIAPPWGKLVALDLAHGKIAWEKPLGTSRDKAPWPFWWIEGAPNMGGPLTTAGGGPC